MSLIKLRHFSVRRKATGISLLEVLLSLTIIAIILVMATRYFFIAANNNRVNTTRQEIGAIIAAVRGWKNAQHGYNEMNYTTIYNKGYLTKTSNMDITGTFPNATVNGVYDPWGNQILLSGNSVDTLKVTSILPNGPDCLKLQVSYPTSECSGNNNATFELYVGRYLG